VVLILVVLPIPEPADLVCMQVILPLSSEQPRQPGFRMLQMLAVLAVGGTMLNCALINVKQSSRILYGGGSAAQSAKKTR
jgi:hypothetical protein